MKKLAHDIARCHDASCRERGECLRWLCRKDDEKNVVHAASLWSGDPCGCKIEVEQEPKA